MESGDVGPTANAWVDRIAGAGQSWWQVLPLGPTGCGHSPYQSLSSFAADLLVLSPDSAGPDGLLAPTEREVCDFPPDRVDFERVILFKERILTRAWQKFRSGARGSARGFERFCAEKGGAATEPRYSWRCGPNSRRGLSALAGRSRAA